MFRIWRWPQNENGFHLLECSKYFNFSRISRAFSSGEDGTKSTHYEVLGISKEATAGDIRAAFIKKSKECHPDTNRNDPNNHKQFILVNEAYSVLSKPPLRHDYDASITYQRVSEHSKSYNSQSTFYHQKEHYDEQIEQIRKASNIRDENYRKYYDEHFRKASNIRDEDYKRYSFNSARRHKISNSKVVAFCVLWTLAGIVIHYFTFRKSTALHLNSLNERDARINKMWVDAKKQAEQYSTEDQILIMLRKQDENKAHSSKVNGNK
jgi:curved DNA-binding protein CbpA